MITALMLIHDRFKITVVTHSSIITLHPVIILLLYNYFYGKQDHNCLSDNLKLTEKCYSPYSGDNLKSQDTINPEKPTKFLYILQGNRIYKVLFLNSLMFAFNICEQLLHLTYDTVVHNCDKY